MCNTSKQPRWRITCRLLPDEHLAADEHERRPEHGREQRAAGDPHTDLERVLVLGVLLAQQRLSARDALLAARRRQHVVAVHERERDRDAERDEEERREEHVVARALHLRLRRVHHGLGRRCVASGLELRLLVRGHAARRRRLLLLELSDAEMSGGCGPSVEEQSKIKQIARVNPCAAERIRSAEWRRLSRRRLQPTINGAVALLAVVHVLELIRVDFAPRGVEVLVGLRVAEHERVRVLGEEDEHRGHGTVDHRHDHVRDRVPDEEAAEAERHLRVAHVHGPLRVAVRDRGQAGRSAQEADRDLAEQEHVHDQRVVRDRRPALGREQVEHALARRHEAVAVDAHVRVREAVEVLDPALDGADAAVDAAHEAHRDGVALLREQLLQRRQEEVDRLDDRHHERAEADRAERQRERAAQRLGACQRHAVARRVVPPARHGARRRDRDDVAQHEVGPEEHEEHADEDPELLAHAVLFALANILTVVHRRVRREDPDQAPEDLQQREHQCCDHDHRVAQHGLARDLQVGRCERDARADAAHVPQHEQRKQRRDRRWPPVKRVAALVQRVGAQEARGDRDRAHGDDREPDEHLAHEQHRERPDERREQRAAGDGAADAHRVVVLGMLLADKVANVGEAVLAAVLAAVVVVVH